MVPFIYNICIFIFFIGCNLFILFVLIFSHLFFFRLFSCFSSYLCVITLSTFHVYFFPCTYVLGSSLLWVFMYGLIFISIYALISFAFFRDIYDPHAGQYCRSVYECWVTVLHQGLIVGTYEVRFQCVFY